MNKILMLCCFIVLISGCDRSVARPKKTKIVVKQKVKPEKKVNSDGKFVTWPMWEVDRAASMWLIKRYINKKAEFTFINKGEPLNSKIPFDIPDADLQRKHNTACFQVIMKKYKFNTPELIALSKLVWDIEINFWGDKKYPESIEFKQKFDMIFNQKLPHQETMKQCFALFDEFVKQFNKPAEKLNIVKNTKTSEKEINIGAFKKDESVIVNFILTNESKDNLKIKRVQKTCGCAEVSINKKEVKPGDEYIVKVVLTAGEELNGPFIKSFYVVTENAGNIKRTVIGNAQVF